jgi:hypothetical protein
MGRAAIYSEPHNLQRRTYGVRGNQDTGNARIVKELDRAAGGLMESKRTMVLLRTTSGRLGQRLPVSLGTTSESTARECSSSTKKVTPTGCWSSTQAVARRDATAKRAVDRSSSKRYVDDQQEQPVTVRLLDEAESEYHGDSTTGTGELRERPRTSRVTPAPASDAGDDDRQQRSVDLDRRYSRYPIEA